MMDDNKKIIEKRKNDIKEKIEIMSDIIKRNDPKLNKLVASELRDILHMRKLLLVLRKMGDIDPEELENRYYYQFDCYTEKQKIRLETQYII